MGLKAPVRGTVHAGGGEGGEAQLAATGGNVLGHLLQGGEVLDVRLGIAGLLEQFLVVDDAVGLNNIGDTRHFAAVHQGEVLAAQLPGDLGTGEVVAVVLPVRQANRTVYLEEGGGLGLGDFAHQGGLVLAGGGGLDLHLNAGLLGVLLGQGLPGGVGFRLEVQVVDTAAGGGGIALRSGVGAAVRGRGIGGAAAAVIAAAAGHQRKDHNNPQGEGQELLTHCHFLLIFFPVHTLFWQRFRERYRYRFQTLYNYIIAFFSGKCKSILFPAHKFGEML